MSIRVNDRAFRALEAEILRINSMSEEEFRSELAKVEPFKPEDVGPQNPIAEKIGGRMQEFDT